MIQVATEEATSLVIESKSIAKIADRDQYLKAAALRGSIRDAVKYFTELYKPRIDEAMKHVTNLRADRDKFLDPLNGAQKHLGDLLSAYDDEQYRLKLEREAAERRKQQAEEAEKAQLAKLAEEMGNADLAEEILERIPEPQAVIVKDTPTAKETGVSFREDWKFRVVDPKAIPREYLMIDEVKIGKVVRALKSASNIAGIEVYSVKIPVQRG
jgi:hypothetical protein